MKRYEIIAGGGTKRTVFVKEGEFDFVRYHRLCQRRYSRCTGSENIDRNSRVDGMEVWLDEWTLWLDELQKVELEFIFSYAMNFVHH